jgi:AcrR family transcriptional regulator
MSTPAINPRKRPQQQRSEATVDAILEATARILESDGLEALSTNAVAARAGVSVGSLYQYFPGKSALLAEVMRRERAALVARVAAIAGAPPSDLEAAVTALIQAAVAHQLERPALARALDFIEPTLPLDGETAALNADLAHMISALIDRHGVTEPHQAARDLIALAKGMIDAAGLTGETNRAALVARVARAALGYLRLF